MNTSDSRKEILIRQNDKLPIRKEFKCIFVTTPEKLLLLLFLVILSLCNKGNIAGKSSVCLPKQFVQKT